MTPWLTRREVCVGPGPPPAGSEVPGNDQRGLGLPGGAGPARVRGAGPRRGDAGRGECGGGVRAPRCHGPVAAPTPAAAEIPAFARAPAFGAAGRSAVGVGGGERAATEWGSELPLRGLRPLHLKSFFLVFPTPALPLPPPNIQTTGDNFLVEKNTRGVTGHPDDANSAFLRPLLYYEYS